MYKWYRLDKEDVESVAYIHFKSQEAVTRFAQAYQGHVFRSKQGKRIDSQYVTTTLLIVCYAGQQSQVIVEYAPFQKIPLKKQKPDAAAGTIDEGTLQSSCQSFARTEPPD
jgi:regulator of nonsense transcripts 3